MGRHRDDEDFGAIGTGRPVFEPLAQVEEFEVDLSDLDLSPPDSSRAVTRPMAVAESIDVWEAAFGETTQIVSRSAEEAVRVEVLNEVPRKRT